MSREYGYIEVMQTTNALGMVDSLTYSLKGGPYVRISREFALDGCSRCGDLINIGPYRFRILEYDYFFGSAVCIQNDYPFSGIIAFLHRISRLARKVNARFIVTLAVWGLARYDAARSPSWYDVYAVKKIVGLLAKARNFQ